MRAGVLAAIVVAFVAATPGAHAFPALLRIDAADGVKIEGPWVLRGEGPSFAIEGDPRTRGAHVEVGAGDLLLVTWERAFVGLEGSGAETPRPASEPHVERIPLRAATLAFEPGAGGARQVLVADASATFRLEARASEGEPVWLVADGGAADPLRDAPGLPLVPDVPRVERRWPEGSVFAGAFHDVVGFPREADAIAIEGALLLQEYDGRLLVQQDGAVRAIPLGVVQRDVDAAGLARAETLRLAVLDAAQARYASPLGGAWGLAAPRADAEVSGPVSWARASGAVVRDGEERPFTGKDVAGRGEVVVAFTRVDALREAYAAEGEWDALQVGGDIVLETAPAALPPAAAVTAAVLTLALLALAALALYTRIARQNVLDHPRRRELYALVRASPGTHARELHRQLGWGWGTFAFHLQVLVRSGLVRTSRDAALLVVAPTDMPPLPPRLGETARRVLDALPEGATLGPTEVARVAGVSRQLASHHLERLVAKGLASRIDRDGGAAYARAQTPAPVSISSAARS